MIVKCATCGTHVPAAITVEVTHAGQHAAVLLRPVRGSDRRGSRFPSCPQLPRRLLVAVDGSGPSVRAVEYAAALARATGAKVQLLLAIDTAALRPSGSSPERERTPRRRRSAVETGAVRGCRGTARALPAHLRARRGAVHDAHRDEAAARSNRGGRIRRRSRRHGQPRPRSARSREPRQPVTASRDRGADPGARRALRPSTGGGPAARFLGRGKCLPTNAKLVGAARAPDVRLRESSHWHAVGFHECKMTFVMLESGAVILTLLMGLEMLRQKVPWRSVMSDL